jgi:hypothetical protein
VNAPPLTFPVNVAVPPVLVMLTNPVVVKEPIFCGAVPAIVTVPVPLAVPPLLIKLPFNARVKVDIDKVAPLLTVNGAVAVKVLFALKVIVPVLEIITPPVAAKLFIHSVPAMRDVDVLYCNAAVAP